MVPVKVFLHHQLAVTGNQQAVNLRGRQRIHGQVDQLLYERLDPGARDADVFHRRHWPPVVQLQRHDVVVSLTGLAARIEGTPGLLVDSGEIEAHTGERYTEDTVVV